MTHQDHVCWYPGSAAEPLGCFCSLLHTLLLWPLGLSSLPALCTSDLVPCCSLLDQASLGLRSSHCYSPASSPPGLCSDTASHRSSPSAASQQVSLVNFTDTLPHTLSLSPRGCTFPTYSPSLSTHVYLPHILCPSHILCFPPRLHTFPHTLCLPPHRCHLHSVKVSDLFCSLLYSQDPDHCPTYTQACNMCFWNARMNE